MSHRHAPPRARIGLAGLRAWIDLAGLRARIGLAGPIALALALTAGPACSLILAEPDTTCGDGIVEGREQCDRDDFQGRDCLSEGFGAGGHLVCNPRCRIETFNCRNDVCGDGRCDAVESAELCPEDCGDRVVTCGDGYCEPSEFNPVGGCGEDCDGVVCGDGYCELPIESELEPCPKDCDSTQFCGDGKCQNWETAVDGCPEDCMNTGPECGNGQCEPGENMTSCPQDCAAQPCDDDGVCAPEHGEKENNCQDCFFCTDDGVCMASEYDGAVSGVCPDCYDLPDCGNGSCGDDEQPETCPGDCPSLCGNNELDAGEECDHGNFASGDLNCATYPARGENAYASGEVTCDALTCRVNTWGCFPRDLGAACQATPDCVADGVTTCLGYGATTGVCTYQCENAADCAGRDPGTTCVDPVHTSFDGPETYCLRPCDTITDCPDGLMCLDNYCLPQE